MILYKKQVNVYHLQENKKGKNTIKLVNKNDIGIWIESFDDTIEKQSDIFDNLTIFNSNYYFMNIEQIKQKFKNTILDIIITDNDQVGLIDINNENNIKQKFFITTPNNSFALK